VYRLVADGTGSRYDVASGGVVGSWVVVGSESAAGHLEGAKSMVAGRLISDMGEVVDSAGSVLEVGIEVEMAAEAVDWTAYRRCRRSILQLPFKLSLVVASERSKMLGVCGTR